MISALSRPSAPICDARSSQPETSPGPPPHRLGTAADIASEAALFCFDAGLRRPEAMVLGRLFTALFETGVWSWRHRILRRTGSMSTACSTSSFSLSSRCSRKSSTWSSSTAATTGVSLDWSAGRSTLPARPGCARGARRRLCRVDRRSARREPTLLVKGRSLVVPCASRGVAWFGFAELCDGPLAAADYLAIAEHFAAVIVEGIPRLSPGQRDAAPALQHPDRRTLRGAHHSAAVPPEAIYVAGAAPSDSSAPFLG